MNNIIKTDLDEGIFVLENVISEEQCHYLIQKSEDIGYSEATVFTGTEHKLIKGVRDNLRVILDDIGMAETIWEKVSPHFTDVIDGFNAYGLNERFRFYRYDSGQRFKRHKDGAFVRGIGDTSIYTFIIYLNDDFEGGTTDFDQVSIKPKKGSALVFLHPILHSGEPVLSGTKYAIRSDVMYRNEALMDS